MMFNVAVVYISGYLQRLFLLQIFKGENQTFVGFDLYDEAQHRTVLRSWGFSVSCQFPWKSDTDEGFGDVLWDWEKEFSTFSTSVYGSPHFLSKKLVQTVVLWLAVAALVMGVDGVRSKEKRVVIPQGTT